MGVVRTTTVEGIRVVTLDGLLHCATGPAVTTPTGYSVWYLNGKRHRDDGPAVIYASGPVQYWIDGKRATARQIEKIKEKEASHG